MNDYLAALETVRAASKKYREVVVAYRNRQIGDAAFLEARAEYVKAEKAFDAACDAVREVAS